MLRSTITHGEKEDQEEGSGEAVSESRTCSQNVQIEGDEASCGRPRAAQDGLIESLRRAGA